MSRTSTPRRGKTGSGVSIGGWFYDDNEQTRFAFSCSLNGFGLPSYDDFIDSLPDGAAKQELLDWRQQALNASKSGNQLALKGWLQAMYVAWNFRMAIDRVQPTVSLGLKQQRGPEANKANAKERNEYLLKRYGQYRLQGIGVTNSRNKANDDMAKKFGKEHNLKLRRLQQLLKG